MDDYTEELRAIVTTLREECGHCFDRLSLQSNVVSNVIDYQKRDFIDEYRKRCFILGSHITVDRMGLKRPALALDVDERARLVVRYEDDGSIAVLSSAEVSLHKS